MRSKRPVDRPDSPRVRTALPRLAALLVALLVVAGGVAGAAGVGAGLAVQETGDDGDPRPVDTGTEYTETIDENDSTDVFTFDVDRGDYVRVDFLVGTPDSVEATIYGPSGNALDSADGHADTVLVGGQAPESGQYRVEFVHTGGYPSSNPEDYSFTVATASPDSYESNDGTGDAAALSDPGTVDAILGEGEEDYYSVTAAENSTISADVDRPTNYVGNSYDVRILDSDGDVLEEISTQCTPGAGPCDPPELSATAPSDGKYYIHVGGGMTGFDAYSMAVNFESPTQDTETPDETTETPEKTTEGPDETTQDPGDSDDSTETDETTDAPDTTEAPTTDDGGSDDSADGTTDDSSSDDSDSSGDSVDSTGDSNTDDTDSEANGGAGDSSDDASGSDDSDTTDDSDASGGDDGSDDTSTTDAPTDTPAPSTDTTTTADVGQTTTEEVTVATTTDGGTEVAAGPAAPMNNSSNGSGAVVRGQSEANDTSGGIGPGFGVVVAVVALLAVALLARSER